MNKSRTLLMVLSLAVIFGCSMPVMQSIDLEKEKITTIGLIPARIRVTLETFSGSKVDPEISAWVERVAQKQVESKFKSLGYTVKTLADSPDEYAQDLELQKSYNGAVEGFSNYLKGLSSSGLFRGPLMLTANTWYKTGPFNIGDSSADLCARVGTDALLFIVGAGAVHGAGRAAAETGLEVLGLNTNNSNPDTISLTLASGKTGVVLSQMLIYADFPHRGAADSTFEKNLSRPIQRAFTNFPRAATESTRLFISEF